MGCSVKSKSCYQWRDSDDYPRSVNYKGLCMAKELRDEWCTPNELFLDLKQQYRFDFDCCASDDNAKCDFYADLENPFEKMTREGLEKVNVRCAWMNPPYTKAYELFKHFFKVIDCGVAIYRCDNMETKIWQDLIFRNANWIFVPNKRISYEGLSGNGSRFPSALIGYRAAYCHDKNGTLLLNVR